MLCGAECHFLLLWSCSPFFLRLLVQHLNHHLYGRNLRNVSPVSSSNEPQPLSITVIPSILPLLLLPIPPLQLFTSPPLIFLLLLFYSSSFPASSPLPSPHLPSSCSSSLCFSPSSSFTSSSFSMPFRHNSSYVSFPP